MQFINKQAQPISFVDYKRKKGKTFCDLSNPSIPKNHTIKDELRVSLLKEQGFLCCYCGQQIEIQNSTIEHIKSRDNHPELQLEYVNMACACKGGKDRRTLNPEYPLYCDASKRNLDISVSPLNVHCCLRFEYSDEGDIFGVDDEASRTIEILNLNNSKLKNLRKAAIDAYRYLPYDEVDWFEELNKTFDRNSEDKFDPFSYVVRNYIVNFRLAL